jgi:ABC-type branched-subunit amino acid transport system ATPase component
MLGVRGADEREIRRRYERALDLFPLLEDLMDRPGWAMSGGQQQKQTTWDEALQFAATRKVAAAAKRSAA